MLRRVVEFGTPPKALLHPDEVIVVEDDVAGWWRWRPLPLVQGGRLVVTSERLLFLYREFSFLRWGPQPKRRGFSRSAIASVRLVAKGWFMPHRFLSKYGGIPTIIVTLYDGDTLRFESFAFEEVAEEFSQ